MLWPPGADSGVALSCFLCWPAAIIGLLFRLESEHRRIFSITVAFHLKPKRSPEVQEKTPIKTLLKIRTRIDAGGRPADGEAMRIRCVRMSRESQPAQRPAPALSQQRVRNLEITCA